MANISTKAGARHLYTHTHAPNEQLERNQRLTGANLKQVTPSVADSRRRAALRSSVPPPAGWLFQVFSSVFTNEEAGGPPKKAPLNVVERHSSSERRGTRVDFVVQRKRLPFSHLVIKEKNQNVVDRFSSDGHRFRVRR